MKKPHSRLRIAYVNPSAEIGGAERALLLLLRCLDRERYEPVVVCPGEGTFTQALSSEDVAYTLSPLAGGERLTRFTKLSPAGLALGAQGMGKALRLLLRELQAIRPDLVHTNGIKAHLLGGICARMLGVPLVWHMRDLVPTGTFRQVMRLSAMLPRRIITVSQAVSEQFAGCAAQARVRTVHDALDVQHVQVTEAPGAIRARYGIPEDALLLVMVAHFTQWKGHRLFLEILASLQSCERPVWGLVVGGSIYTSAGHEAYETEVRSYAQELAIGSRVVFTGFQQAVADHVNAADILVHPPTRPEPFGLGVIEAMALGKPVVAAAAGGILETVAHGVSGLHVPPGEGEGFAAAVRSLAGSPDRRQSMGDAGKRRVNELFRPGLHLERVEAVYRELVRLP